MLRMLCFWLGAAILSGPTALDALGQEVLQPAGEVKHCLVRRLFVLDERGIAGPADLDATEEISWINV